MSRFNAIISCKPTSFIHGKGILTWTLSALRASLIGMPAHPHLCQIEAALSPLIRHIPTTVYAFTLAGIILYGIEALAESEKLSLAKLFDFCFPRKHWLSRSTKVDAVIYLVSKVTQRFITLACQLGVAFLVSVAVASIKLHFHIKSPLHETVAADIFCLCMVFALTDFSEFLSHYVQHHVPMLWEFHKVHHSATFLTPLTTTRFHPVGNLIDGIFISVFLIPPVLLAELCFNLSLVRVVELSATVELFFALTFLRQLQHSHFRISSLMHHVHHSAKREHWDKKLRFAPVYLGLMVRLRGCIASRGAAAFWPGYQGG